MKNEKGTLSVIIPAYNEERIIYQNALQTSEILNTFLDRYEVLIIDDGSSDNTLEEAKKAQQLDSHILVFHYENNGGKGKAIRCGIRKTHGDFIAFLDADLELSPFQLKDFLEAMEREQADIVIGSKLHKDSQIVYPLKRKIASYSYYLLLYILFHLKLKDTQTGLKLFKSGVLKPIAASMRTTSFAFDIEILASANKQHCKIIEMPIRLIYNRDTSFGRIKLRDIYCILKDTFSIYFRLHSKHDRDQ